MTVNVRLKNEEKYKKGIYKEIGELINQGTKLSKDGLFGKAIEIWDKALEIDQNDVVVLCNKGQSYSNLSRFDQAIKLFDKSISLDPKNANAHYNKACAMINKNEIESGLDYLELAIKYDKNFSEIAKKDDDFLFCKSNSRFQILVGE